MTVQSQISKMPAQAMNGIATVFSFTFRALTEFPDAIKVTIVDTTTDTETELIKDDPGIDGYTVSIDTDGVGGSITVINARSADYTLTIYREYTIAQLANYADYNSFPADTVENSYDLRCMVEQQLDEIDSRTLTLPITVTGVDTELPYPEAGRPIGWNDAADGLTNYPSLVYQLQVDVDATPDYLGELSSNGVLRVDGTLNYADGGDFVTLSVIPGAVDHDALLNFVALEHVDHSAVSVIAGTGLGGGGTIQADRTLNVTADYAIITANDAGTDITAGEMETLTDGSNADGLHTHASITDDKVKVDAAATADYIGELASNGVIRTGLSISVADGGDFITLSVSEANVDHDSLLNYVANEHVDHSAVSILTTVNTSGLAGGGDLTANRNLVVDIANTTAGTVAGGDLVLIADIDDSNNLKRVTAQSIADLGAGGGAVAIEDEGVPLTAAVSLIDFVGAGVTATNVGSVVTVTIPGGGGGATLDHDVTQANAFSVGEWIYHNGTIYVLADASAAATAESIGVVTAATGADFTVQFGGRITGLSGLTAGEAHFLSETAGAITATAPATEGSVIKPVLIADSTTTGFIFNMRGIEVTSTTSFYQLFTSGAGLTPSFNHNLGHKYCQVQVFNNNDKLIMPDDITLTDDNNLQVDLTSYGTRTGDWHVVILDIGTTNANTNTAFTSPIAIGAGAVVAINHGLNSLYPIVQVYDENGDVIQPDDITSTDADNTSIDLTSYGTRGGTYNAVILAGGSVTLSTASDLSIAGQTTGDRLEFDGTNWLRKEACLFSAYITGNQIISVSGVLEDVQFDAEVYDIGSNFNTGTYIFTAPVTGYYDFKVAVLWGALQTDCSRIDIALVTTARTYYTAHLDFDHTGFTPAIARWAQQLNVIADMTAGDTAKVQVTYTGTTGTTYLDDGTGTDSTRFQGYLIA